LACCSWTSESPLAAEYGVGSLRASTYSLARWISSDDRTALTKFMDENRSAISTMSTASGVPGDLGLHDATH